MLLTIKKPETNWTKKEDLTSKGDSLLLNYPSLRKVSQQQTLFPTTKLQNSRHHLQLKTYEILSLLVLSISLEFYLPKQKVFHHKEYLVFLMLLNLQNF